MKLLTICLISLGLFGAVNAQDISGETSNERVIEGQQFESESGLEGTQLKTESDIDPYSLNKGQSFSGEDDQELSNCQKVFGFEYSEEEINEAPAETIIWEGGSINYEATISPGKRKIDYEDEGVIYKYRESKGGKTTIDYESDTEAYHLKKHQDGSTEYDYYIDGGNEFMDVDKSKDGSGKVKYKAKFDDINDVNKSDLIELGEPRM